MILISKMDLVYSCFPLAKMDELFKRCILYMYIYVYTYADTVYTQNNIYCLKHPIASFSHSVSHFRAPISILK